MAPGNDDAEDGWRGQRRDRLDVHLHFESPLVIESDGPVTVMLTVVMPTPSGDVPVAIQLVPGTPVHN